MSGFDFDEPEVITDEEKLAILKREQDERDKRWKMFHPILKKQLATFHEQNKISKQSPNKIRRKRHADTKATE